jgi:hypothetical protein
LRHWHFQNFLEQAGSEYDDARYLVVRLVSTGVVLNMYFSFPIEMDTFVKKPKTGLQLSDEK